MSLLALCQQLDFIFAFRLIPIFLEFFQAFYLRLILCKSVLETRLLLLENRLDVAEHFFLFCIERQFDFNEQAFRLRS